MLWTSIVCFILLGAGLGFIAGLFGIGGGLLAVPVLDIALQTLGVSSHISIHYAVTSSLASIGITAIAAVMTHYRYRHIDGAIVRYLLAPVLLGTLTSHLIALHSDGLRGLFTGVLCLLALRLLRPKAVTPSALQPQYCNSLATAGIAFTVSFLSATLGLGGGLLFVPLFRMYYRLPLTQAVGTAATLTLPLAWTATLLHWFSTPAAVPSLPHRSGYIYWPAVLAMSTTSLLFAPLGVRCVRHWNPRLVEKLLAVILIGVALLMGWQVWR